MSNRPEGGRRSAGGVCGAMRRKRPHQSVRAATEMVIAAPRTVLGAKVTITPPWQRFPLGPAGRASLKPNLMPGQQGSRPGICSMAKPRKAETTIPVLRWAHGPCQRKSTVFRAFRAKVIATG